MFMNRMVQMKKIRELLPFQKSCVEFSRGKEGVVINLDMGLGKTLVSQTILKEDEKEQFDALIIAPAELTDQWEEDLIKEFPDADILYLDPVKKNQVGFKKKLDRFLCKE